MHVPRRVLRVLPGALAGVAAAAILATVVAVAVDRNGKSVDEALVPASSRLATQVHLGPAHVLLVSGADKTLSVLVAYQSHKGWLGAQSGSAPLGAIAAWTSTRAEGPVPALSVAYGTAHAAKIRVHWVDGRVDVVRPEKDGSWLDVRRGRVPTTQVELLGSDGHLLSAVAGP